MSAPQVLSNQDALKLFDYSKTRNHLWTKAHRVSTNSYQLFLITSQYNYEIILSNVLIALISTVDETYLSHDGVTLDVDCNVLTVTLLVFIRQWGWLFMCCYL